MDLGRHAEALKMLHGLAAEEPGNAAVLCRIAATELALKHNKAALQAAEDAIAAAPEKEWGHRLRSIALDRMKRKKEAMASAETARSLEPDEPLALYYLFWMYQNNKRKRDADEVLQELLRVAPDSWYAHYAAGSAAIAKKQLAAAEQHFRDALRVNPTSWQAQNNLGVTLMRQGKRRKALDAFWGAAKSDPTSPLVRSNIRTAAMRKVTFVGFFLFLALQVERVTGNFSGWGAVLAFCFFVALIALAIWLYRGPISNLPPEIRQFLRDERRRERMRYVRPLGDLIRRIGERWKTRRGRSISAD
jgi:tetratricopeptide (TPR) repeat protein